MDDAGGMRPRQPVGELPRQIGRDWRAERSPAQQVEERLALDQLHRDVADAVVLPDVVHDHDVGVIEAGSESRFALEALAAIEIPRQIGRQGLEGDDSTESGIASAIHLPHAATSDRAQDLVDANPFTGVKGHGGNRL